MSQIQRHCFLPALALLAFSIILPLHLTAQSSAAQPAVAPDATLYTNYYGSLTTVNWIVCGSTEESEGCYGFGNIGPFVSVGAMLESVPSVAGDVVTRYIYVVDAGASPVTLYVYKKTDTVSSSSDTTVVTLYKTVSLAPLVGGDSVTTYMAANTRYLYIGTSQSPNAVSVNKSNLKVSELGGFSPPIDVTSITSDEYGYVTVTQGSAFSVYGPNGSFEEDGGGTQFMLGTTQAVPASSLLIGDFGPSRQVEHKPKAQSAVGAPSHDEN
jgi:hypothetical protein